VIFRPFYYYDLGCASYLLGCGTVGTCAGVDPRADDVDSYVAFAEAKKMRIAQVIDTHVHADHRSGGVTLATRGSQWKTVEHDGIRAPLEPDALDGSRGVHCGLGRRAGETCGDGANPGVEPRHAH
jgi:hydroxyacylglutathione hydrolase